MVNTIRIDRVRRAVGVLLVALAPQVGAVEPVTVGDLARLLAASRAMQAGELGGGGDAETAFYRAGRFDGYLTGMAEVLLARGEICVAGCFCHVRERLDPALADALADPALDHNQPAAPWLAARLRAAYPCAGRP